MVSLTDLRARPIASRPTDTYEVCLDADLVVKMRDLMLEAQELTGSRRNADRQRLAENIEERKALGDQVDAASGTLTLRANLTNGEWRDFVDANPARAEGDPGHGRDQRHTYGLLNADALLDDLKRYAHAWNGEPLAPGDWESLLEPNIYAGDLYTMATKVVSLYEGTSPFVQLRSALSSGLVRPSDFAEPAPSESPRSDSTGGSPDGSSEDSTVTETPAP